MQHLIVRSVLNHGSIQFEPCGIKDPSVIILKIYLISTNWEVFLERMAGWIGWLIAGGRLGCANEALQGWSAAYGKCRAAADCECRAAACGSAGRECGLLGVLWRLAVQAMRHFTQMKPAGRNAALGNAERHEHSERFASAICFAFCPPRAVARRWRLARSANLRGSEARSGGEGGYCKLPQSIEISSLVSCLVSSLQ